MDDGELKRVMCKMSQLDARPFPVLVTPDEEDSTIEYRSTSRVHTQTRTSNADGNSFVRVTAYETSRVQSSQGEADIFKSKHITVTTPDNMSGEGLFTNGNERSQTLKKLKSTFLSKVHPTQEPKPDPFARFGTRSVADGTSYQEKSVIEIHKFPFAEPFSTPNSIKKEQVSYSTQVRSIKGHGQNISNIIKTKMHGEGGTCTVESKEITICKNDDATTLIEEID